MSLETPSLNAEPLFSFCCQIYCFIYYVVICLLHVVLLVGGVFFSDALENVMAHFKLFTLLMNFNEHLSCTYRWFCVEDLPEEVEQS